MVLGFVFVFFKLRCADFLYDPNYTEELLHATNNIVLNLASKI